MLVIRQKAYSTFNTKKGLVINLYINPICQYVDKKFGVWVNQED